MVVDVEVEVDVDVEVDVEVDVLVLVLVTVTTVVSGGETRTGSQSLTLRVLTGRPPNGLLVFHGDNGSSLTQTICRVLTLQSCVLGSGLGWTSRSCRLPFSSSKVMVHKFSGSKSSHELISWSVRFWPLTKMDWKPHSMDTLHTT